MEKSIEKRLSKREKIHRKLVYGRTMSAVKYFLLTVTLSFIGWLYEVILMKVRYGTWEDRGFLHAPICPIYGCTLLFIYFFLGTPKEKKGICKRIKNPLLHTALYLAFAFLIPTIAELSVGLFFDKNFHITLWSYAGISMNYNGYISLPISFIWSLMIYVFMRWLFPVFKMLIFKIPDVITLTLSAVLFVVLLTDVSVSFLQI